MTALFIILIVLIGFRPDADNQNISHPTPSGGDSPSAASEPLAKGAFGRHMKEIPLGNSTLKAIVDDEDYERCMQLSWFLSSQGYVVHTVNRKPLRPATIYLARFIMGNPSGLKVDHKKHNKLDNRKSELRAAAHRLNCANRLPTNGRVTPKGVTWYAERRKWVARIRVNTASVYLGIFSNQRDASIAYNNAARLYFGDFAYLNPA